ncbi:MAG: XdhC family protein [Fusobacteriaceae bacterium]
MEALIMKKIADKIEKDEGVALVTLVHIDGSSPGKKGSIMAVFEDGETFGTVGGGNLEFTLKKESLEAISENSSRELEFKLVEDAGLHMKCGGSVKAFIKVFEKKNRLIIVGGGHIGGELYQLGSYLDFKITMIDDREEFCNSKKYPLAKNLVGDIGEILRDILLNRYTYVVIVSRGHLGDKDALSSTVGRGAKYLGMIGSRKKIRETYIELMEYGVSRDELDKVHSPIGLDISCGSPKEIGFAIMSEILKIKNNLTGKPMRELKRVW